MHACADTHIHSVSVTHAHVQWAASEGVAFTIIAKIALIHTHIHSLSFSLSLTHAHTVPRRGRPQRVRLSGIITFS
jgi:hypothetical protein